MPTLWFAYSAVSTLDDPEPISSPYTISYHVGHFLRKKAAEIGYVFQYRNLDEDFHDYVWKDDIVIGHTNYPNGWTNAALDSEAKVKIVLQPYQHYMVGDNEIPWIKSVFAKADHLCLITGPYWWDTMDAGPFGEWKDKATRFDMAVNPALHPHSKTRWNAPGKRKFLCMGTDRPYKGLDWIADLFQQCGAHLGYYGDAPDSRFGHVPQFFHYGGAVFTPELQSFIGNEYDFFISLGRADANPTTLLETPLWGLLPLCNERSGYPPGHRFNVLQTPMTKENMEFNLRQIDFFQSWPEYGLNNMVAYCRAIIERDHDWPTFCNKLWSEIEKRL